MPFHTYGQLWGDYRISAPAVPAILKLLVIADRARLNSGVERVLLKDSFDPAQLIAIVRGYVAKTRQTQKVPEAAS